MERKKAEIQQLGSRIRDNIKDGVLEAVRNDREEKILEDLRRRLIVSLIFVTPLFLVAMIADRTLYMLALQIVMLIPIIVVNHRCFIDGFSAFYKGRPEKNTLSAVGSIISLLMAQFATAGIVLSTMAVCRFSEAYVNYKLDDHLKKLIEAEPEDPKAEPGTELTISRNEVIPADGVITEILEDPDPEVASLAVDEEIVTGVRVPVNKRKGEPVFAGTRVRAGAFRMRVTHSGEDAVISRIIDHITGSIATRAPIAERAEKMARILVYIVLALAALSIVVRIVMGPDTLGAIMTSVTVLIIASPYMFSVGVPMSVLAATVRGAKEGILIRSADILELARDINTIAMNKTGTITAGRPEVSDVLMLEDGFNLQIAAALELGSPHPVGKAIQKLALEKHGGIPPAQELINLSGRGIRGIVNGKKYIAGNAAFMRENGISMDLPSAEPLFRQGKSLVFFANESRVIGVIALRDAPKPVSLKAISQIEGMGIDTVMLTGDSELTAEAIRNEVGIDQICAEIRPEEKAQAIRDLRSHEQKLVAMVGNSLDDAEAIEAANIGIAVGAGQEFGARTADVTLIADDLTDVVRAITLSRKTIRFLRQDFVFAIVYNVLAIAAAIGLLEPMAGPVLAQAIASLCMSISQILVVASTLRIKTTPI